MAICAFICDDKALLYTSGLLGPPGGGFFPGGFGGFWDLRCCIANPLAARAKEPIGVVALSALRLEKKWSRGLNSELGGNRQGADTQMSRLRVDMAPRARSETCYHIEPGMRDVAIGRTLGLLRRVPPRRLKLPLSPPIPN